MTPARLMKSPEGRKRLIDELPANSYEVFEIAEADVKKRVELVLGGKPPADLPFSKSKQWSIVIFDEGPPEPNVGHFKHSPPFTRSAFQKFALSQELAVSQLTLPKLARLMDRYRGEEWLPTKLVHLDSPEIEQADVTRGLKAYCAVGPDHKKRFSELYQQLPKERQALTAAALHEIAGTEAD